MAQPTRAAARCARLRRPFSRQNLPDTKLVARIYGAVAGQCLALRKRRVPGAQSQFLSQPTRSLGLREGSSPLRPPRGRDLSGDFHRQRSGGRRCRGDRTAHRRVPRVARERARILTGPLDGARHKSAGSDETVLLRLSVDEPEAKWRLTSVVSWNRFNIRPLAKYRPLF